MDTTERLNNNNLFNGASLVAHMVKVKNLPACRSPGFDVWVSKILWRREWQSTSVFLPREFHGQRSLTGYRQSLGSQRVGHMTNTHTFSIHKPLNFLKDTQ